jgi:hypothetical protein
MMPGQGTGMIGAMLLIALGVGYFVLRQAYLEKGPLRRIGVVIGFTIIVLSGAMVIMKSVYTLGTYTGLGKGCCPMAKKAGMMSQLPCPMMKK